MLGDAGHHPRAKVRCRTHIEDDPPVGELSDEPRVLNRPDPVPDAVSAKQLESGLDRIRAGRLTGVRNRAQPSIAGDGEGPNVGLRWVAGLETTQAQTDDAALAVLHRPPGHLAGLFR